MTMRRRTLLAGALAAPLAACQRRTAPAWSGGWIGADAERGHRLRDSKSGALPAPAVQRRADVIVVGGGIAGLAAARALAAAGIDNVQLLELEDMAGGNSRGHVLGGMACPLGAHYLPVPGERAVEVIELLEALGLRRTERGVVVYDEMTLCHSPQERLRIGGFWHDGLLPAIDALPAAQRDYTLAQYRRFGAAVAAAGADGAFAIPTARARWSPALDALDAQTFTAWLDAQRLDAPALRWYLDYCCRDDYGAGAAQVSAWAGLHYFASRHGFHAPGDAADERDPVLTWPEGNAWLARKLAEPLRERLHTGVVVWRVDEGRDEVSVDLWNASAQRSERWRAPQVVLALPLFVAARLLAAPPAALTQAAAALPHAPWLVGNLHLNDALIEHPGAPLSWDNVVYEPGRENATLGYVDAMHQSTRALPGPTVLTAYWALGGDTRAQLVAQRARLLAEPWSAWADAVVQDLARVHPDLRAKLRQVDLTRYGHAMCVPVPGLRSSAALRALAEPQPRIQFAHSDLSAYSVFEEALYQGTRAGAAAARRLGTSRRR
ncbi:MAG TPA: FAD-dependent oxidoreductase [Burkholderiaceae bacterium]|nr:FAD-dependent oxidoreductase [Burkholderiaceae bacterium]